MKEFLARVHNEELWTVDSPEWPEVLDHWINCTDLGYILFPPEAQRRDAAGQIVAIGPAVLTRSGRRELLPRQQSEV